METMLKSARTAHGWSQLRVITELQLLGGSRHIPMPTRESLKTQLSRWENGHVTPHEPYRTLLADIFGVLPDELGFADGPAPIQTVKLSNGSIRSMEALLGQFIEVDNTVGPQRLLELAAQQVSTLEPTLVDARGPTRQDGLRLCSRFAEFAGWLAQDAGDLVAAQQWTDLSMDFAEEVGDLEHRAYVLMRKSGIASERRDRGRALTLAMASCHDLARLTPPVRALALRQAAICHALVGDRRRSEHASDLAVGAIADDDAGGSDGVNSVGYVTPAYVRMETGLAAFQLRRYDKAADHLAGALAAWPAEFARDRGLCLARLAVVEATRGNVDVACAVGRDAILAYQAAGSARVRATLVSLKQRLTPYDRSAFVSEFRKGLARLK